MGGPPRFGPAGRCPPEGKDGGTQMKMQGRWVAWMAALALAAILLAAPREGAAMGPYKFIDQPPGPLLGDPDGPTAGGRAFIVNEAHGLRAAIVRRLLCMFEPIPPHIVWIFTTTAEGQEKLFEDLDDAHPLLSRCTRLELSRRGLAEVFAQRAKTIAEVEGASIWLSGDSDVFGAIEPVKGNASHITTILTTEEEEEPRAG